MTKGSSRGGVGAAVAVFTPMIDVASPPCGPIVPQEAPCNIGAGALGIAGIDRLGVRTCPDIGVMSVVESGLLI